MRVWRARVKRRKGGRAGRTWPVARQLRLRPPLASAPSGLSALSIPPDVSLALADEGSGDRERGIPASGRGELRRASDEEGRGGAKTMIH
ncbi:hypothetical protein PRIPAC_92099 [Pristionchus pacificus]|nr:hypothetical protein PRIPAC_92099 [Pristionchus pacificus]|eukprot:PDM63300.1 hypothetical protein PRIPAC_50515 [Pristionchus pacificus]